MAIFLFDTLWISWVIYSSEGLNSDLYLIYFLVVFMSGLQMRVWQSFLIGTVASLLYIGLWVHARPNEDLLNTHTLLRLPFFYMVSFFTAYFAQQVQERERDLKARHGLEMAKAERRAMAGRLAGRIAFEMNNPLSIVIGFAQGLLKRMDPSDQRRLAAQHMFQEANRCRAMIESLLLLSDQAWAEMDAVALNTVILDEVSALREEGLLERGRVELREELEEGMPFIRGERRQLGRAVRELVKNSLDAMPQGGVLTLRTSCLRTPSGDEIQCVIQDAGHGIAPDAAAQIFEPFFTTKEGEGKGLGLSYVSSIVHRHRGSIDFDSGPGRGTKFTMRLPAEGRVLLLGVPGRTKTETKR